MHREAAPSTPTRPGDPAASAVPAAVVTTSAAFLPSALDGLRRRFPGAEVEQLAPEVGRVRGPAASAAAVAAACRDAGRDGGQGAALLAFVRHVAAEDLVVPLGPGGAGDRVAGAALRLATGSGRDDLAVQVWASGTVGDRAPDVRAAVVAALEGAGVATARGGRSEVLGVCLTPAGAAVGLTAAADALADWPGGRIVLGRPPGQVSRAEWKLEELYKLGALPPSPVPPAGEPARALDLGASPGGWTRILRQRGYEVWAVDPGDLDPRVSADPGVHHERTTAGELLDATDLRFDLVVNDMRMVAESSSRVMVDAAERLRPGGSAVVTLKVGRRRPAVTVRRALDVLSRTYEPVLVRQLYHNRNEVSVVARRPDRARPGSRL